MLIYFFERFIYWFDNICVIFFFLVNSFYALLLILSFPAIARRFRELQIEDIYHLLQSDSLPPISVIVPVHNQDDIIVNSVRSILELSYPSKEVIIVNDGSTDDSLQKLIEAYKFVKIPTIFPSSIKTAKIKNLYQSQLFVNLKLIDKENGGKGDSLNAGMNIATAPLFLGIEIGRAHV